VSFITPAMDDFYFSNQERVVRLLHLSDIDFVLLLHKERNKLVRPTSHLLTGLSFERNYCLEFF